MSGCVRHASSVATRPVGCPCRRVNSKTWSGGSPRPGTRTVRPMDGRARTRCRRVLPLARLLDDRSESDRQRRSTRAGCASTGSFLGASRHMAPSSSAARTTISTSSSTPGRSCPQSRAARLHRASRRRETGIVMRRQERPGVDEDVDMCVALPIELEPCVEGTEARSGRRRTSSEWIDCCLALAAVIQQTCPEVDLVGHRVRARRPIGSHGAVPAGGDPPPTVLELTPQARATDWACSHAEA